MVASVQSWTSVPAGETAAQFGSPGSGSDMTIPSVSTHRAVENGVVARRPRPASTGHGPHPDAIIGLPASSQMIPLAPTIAQAGVPFFSLSSAIQVVRSAPGTPQNLNQIRPINTDIAAAQTNYVVKDLKAKKIGLVCVQNS